MSLNRIGLRVNINESCPNCDGDFEATGSDIDGVSYECKKCGLRADVPTSVGKVVAKGRNVED